LNGVRAAVSIGAGEVWLFGLSESAGYRFILIETLIRRSRTHRRGRRIFFCSSHRRWAGPGVEDDSEDEEDWKGKGEKKWLAWAFLPTDDHH